MYIFSEIKVLIYPIQFFLKGLLVYPNFKNFFVSNSYWIYMFFLNHFSHGSLYSCRNLLHGAFLYVSKHNYLYMLSAGIHVYHRIMLTKMKIQKWLTMLMFLHLHLVVYVCIIMHLREPKHWSNVLICQLKTDSRMKDGFKPPHLIP